MTENERRPIVLAPDAGRGYEMGGIHAVFKADRDETAGAYSMSTWRLDPHTTGPGAHHHPEDDVFLVVDGTMSFYVADHWIDAPAGTFVLVPGGVVHDFENRGDAPATAFNVSAPGDFEEHMPGIVEWFAEHPPGRAG